MVGRRRAERRPPPNLRETYWRVMLGSGVEALLRTAPTLTYNVPRNASRMAPPATGNLLESFVTVGTPLPSLDKADKGEFKVRTSV